ncbi:hypothetical protein [uncultured Paraglaciecola sp.]|uniref:hypothetical protein n=1 Tax=uncultured Paraglaciecola sp. TaxID=1765024 RepID=UPI0026136678|nr:hypothetical protein [uncultured Paraglaciecola sp.]
MSYKKVFLIYRGADEIICYCKSELEAGKIYSLMVKSGVYTDIHIGEEFDDSYYSIVERKRDSLLDLIESTLISLSLLRHGEIDDKTKNIARLTINFSESLICENIKIIKGVYLGNLSHQNLKDVVDNFDCSVYKWLSKNPINWLDKNNG